MPVSTGRVQKLVIDQVGSPSLTRSSSDAVITTHQTQVPLATNTVPAALGFITIELPCWVLPAAPTVPVAVGTAGAIETRLPFRIPLYSIA